MPLVTVGDVELWYETFGEPTDVPVLLVSGVGTQSIRFDDEFCQGLADRFFHVIRFDNRDVGLSTRCPGNEDVAGVMAAVAAGEPYEIAYTLSDMAADAVGLLDVLGIDAAHIYGVSMGGMIVQLMAIEHPTRVLSLTSVMSTTGNREYGQATEEAITALLSEGPTERDAAIEHDVSMATIWASPDYLNEDYLRDMLGRQWDRGEGRDRNGGTRQACAIVASPSRDEQLAELDVPTLVIHGDLDPLVGPSGGERTAEVIPGAELLMIEGMGHDSPPELFGPIIEAFTRHAIAAMS